jgi:transposase InsO family protein
MRQQTRASKEPAEKVVQDIRRATRKHYSAEEKTRIVLEGLRGEDSIAELCRREGIAQNLYYRWSKDFLEAGKKRLAGDTARAATSDEVNDLRREAMALKEVVADLTLELVEQSHLPVRRSLEQIGIPRSTFYRWCDLYQIGGPEALDDCSPRPDRVWNRIPDDVRARIVTLALDEPELSPRELAVRFTDAERYFVSEASVYRLLKAHDLITSPAFIVMKAADEFKDKTTAPNQLWQTDFTYLKVTGWGWFYLSSVLDDFSRYIVAWKLCTTMKAEDVTDTLELALQASGLDQINVAHRPRLLSDNGPSYVSVELAAWLDKQDMPHIRGAPYHPMTQGKIERWHLTLKNRILLENYYLPGQLEARIEAFVAHYNHLRYHESIDNLTPADVYFGRGQTILLERERIKRKTIQHRRLHHKTHAA